MQGKRNDRTKEGLHQVTFTRRQRPLTAYQRLPEAHTVNVERPLNAGPSVRLLAVAFIQSGRGGRDSVEQTVVSGGGEVLQVRDQLVIAAVESSVACVNACLALDADVRAGVSCGDILYDGEMVQVCRSSRRAGSRTKRSRVQSSVQIASSPCVG